MLFYYILLLDHLNDSSRIISLDVMKNRFGFYDVIKKLKGNSSGEKSNNKGLVYQVALCTYWGICLLVRERCAFSFIPSCTALAHLGYAVTIGPPLVKKWTQLFHSTAPLAGLVCLQQG